MFETLLKWAEWLCLKVTVVLFLGLIAAVLLQVFARYALANTPVWTEELARFLLIYMVAVACGIAARRRELVNVDLLLNLLPQRIRRTVLLLLDAAVIAFCAVFFFHAIEYVEFSAMQNATTLPIPMSWITASVLLIAANLLLFTTANLVRDARLLMRGES